MKLGDEEIHRPTTSDGENITIRTAEDKPCLAITIVEIHHPGDGSVVLTPGSTKAIQWIGEAHLLEENMITAAIEIEVVREVPETAEIDAGAVEVAPIVPYRTIPRARDPTVDQDQGLVPLREAAVGVNMTVVEAASGRIVAAVVVDEVARVEGVMASEATVAVAAEHQEVVVAVRGADHDRHPIPLPPPLLLPQATNPQIHWLTLEPNLPFLKISVQSLCRNLSCEQRKRTFVAISEER